MRAEPWRPSAPCAQINDGDLWFPEEKQHAGPAKQICARCPYKAPCVLGAIERNERHGIWGGLTIPQIRKVRSDLGVAA